MSNDTAGALPTNAGELFPIDSPLIDPETLPASRKEALGELREALACGLVRVQRPSVTDGLEIATVDRFGLPFSALLCRRTGMIYTSPQLVEADLPVYYERFYHRLHLARPVAESQGLYQEDDAQGASIWRRFAPHRTAARNSVSVLEIGAGVGNVLAGFRQSALAAGVDVDLMGADFSSECVEVARKRGIPMIKGGFSEATALDSRFDIVILSHVFEHMVDLDSALVDLRRLLQPGGVVYIEVPGVLSIHRRPVYRFDWVAYFTHAHIYHFCLATLDNVLSSHGFELISGNEEVEALFRCLDAPDATPVLKDLPETAAFLQGYLAMLATERAWNRGSPDSTLNRIDELTRELHKAKAVVAYYDEKRRSIGWLFRQMVRSAVPGLDGYLRRRERGR